MSSLARLDKQRFLPLPTAYVRDLSLSGHLALAACRLGQGNRHLIYELVRATYLSYFMWKRGCGEGDYELYSAMKYALETAASSADSEGVCLLDGGNSALMERVMRIYDEQIDTVSTQVYMQSREDLNQIVREFLEQKADIEDNAPIEFGPGAMQMDVTSRTAWELPAT